MYEDRTCMRTVVAGLVECRSHLYQAARDKFALGASSRILATLLYFALGALRCAKQLLGFVLCNLTMHIELHGKMNPV